MVSLTARCVRVVRAINAFIAGGHRVVVHCRAGMGRTGHVLAAWVYATLDADPADGTPLTAERAIELVARSGNAFRNAREAESDDGPLEPLLERVRTRVRG